MAARLKDRYNEEIRPKLMERFGYTSAMQAPKVEKIVLNMGVGEAKQDSKMLEAAQEQLGDDRRPEAEHPPRAQVDRPVQGPRGMPVGLSVTLRGERAYEFLDRLMSVAIPRIRDFRGLNPRSFDGRGNYTIGVREQIIFPEIDYDAIDQVRGLDVTIVTSAQTDGEAFALLDALGMPFAREGRPAFANDIDRRGRLTWPRRPSACGRHASPSTRPADTPGAAAAAVRAPCTASSACAGSACASSRTRASSPA